MKLVLSLSQDGGKVLMARLIGEDGEEFDVCQMTNTALQTCNRWFDEMCEYRLCRVERAITEAPDSQSSDEKKIGDMTMQEFIRGFWYGNDPGMEVDLSRPVPVPGLDPVTMLIKSDGGKDSRLAE